MRLKTAAKFLPLAIFLALGAVLVVLGATRTTPASADDTVTWTGQGTHIEDGHRVLDTVECDENNTPYLLWIFTLGGAENTVTSATLALGGSGSGMFTVNNTDTDVSDGTGFAGGSVHITTPFYDLSGLTASVSYVGDLGKGNANLVISHGCPGTGPTPSPSPSPSPSATPSPSPEVSPSPSPESSPSPSPSPSASPSPTETQTEVPSPSPSPSATTPTGTPTETQTPTETSTQTSTTTPTETVTTTPTGTSTSTPTGTQTTIPSPSVSTSATPPPTGTVTGTPTTPTATATQPPPGKTVTPLPPQPRPPSSGTGYNAPEDQVDLALLGALMVIAAFACAVAIAALRTRR